MTLPGSPTQLTFSPKIAERFVLEGIYSNPNINSIHTVLEGVLGRTQLAMLNRFGLAMRADAGCGAPVNTANLTAFEKYLDPKGVEIVLNQCWTDIRQSFMAFAQRPGIQRYNLDTNGVWSLFWADYVLNASEEELLRKVWFDDTAILASALTGGAAEVPYFNQIDGLWKKIFAGITAGDIIQTTYTIAENNAATAAAQLTLGANTAVDAFQSLMLQADSRLINDPNAFILATDSLCRSYEAFLMRQGNSASWVALQSGIQALRYGRFNVVPMSSWDRTIQAYFKPGLVYDKPHRALLTTPDALVVATDALASFGQFDPYFDVKEKDYTTRVNALLDAQYTWGYKICAVL